MNNTINPASPLIKRLKETSLGDIAAVGGKNASLGEMMSKLDVKGIRVPDGFATTSFAFEKFLSHNSLHTPLFDAMQQLEKKNFSNLEEIGEKARNLILRGEMPADVIIAIRQAYQRLSAGRECIVAVRSSATAEDLPQASFAGQHESYLNVKGEEELIKAIHKCYASLYTDRAIKYREDNGFPHEKVALSVGVQRMVRADLACSGIGFTLEPESGFRDIIHLSGTWGLGENIVQGAIIPDEYFVFKPSLARNKYPIIQKKLGSKSKTMVFDDTPGRRVVNINTPAEKQEQFVLNDAEIIQLAGWCQLIEQHYGKPMDIEWAKDGISQELFLLQARPETVHARKNSFRLHDYQLTEKGEVLAHGDAIGALVASGKARILASPEEGETLAEGDIIVTEITSPDWDPLMKKAGGIITDKGGRTSHAAIVARELGVPAIVGCNDATARIKDGETITLSFCQGKTGFVYRGKLSYTERDIDLSRIKKPEKTKVMLIAGDPDQAFRLSFFPNDGVGLMRLEFIITHAIGIHPMAAVNFASLKDQAARQLVDERTNHSADKPAFFVNKLAEGIATIAAAFYPKDVIVRLSDFKTNEYANLLGGKEFEPGEENPMLGFRGASRYYNDLYKPGFRLECQALRKVRDDMGLTNVKVMIPFCRTVAEGERVIQVMREFGLKRGVNGLEIYVMAEIPSNVVLAEKFANLFDGFSIGSNDLTQLTLGIDRDSSVVSPIFSEQDEASMWMIGEMIRKARRAKSKIGLCGQAPSDFPEFAQFLVAQGIDSISFNADALLKGIENINVAEAMLKKTEMKEPVVS